MTIRGVLFGLLAAPCLFASDQDAANMWKGWMVKADAFHREGRLAESVDAGKHALALAKGFGATDPRIPTTYTMLAGIYRDWGHCGESRDSFAHSVALWKKQENPNPRYVFHAILGLISEASECDDFAVAEKLYRIHEADLQHFRSTRFEDAKLLAVQGSIARGRKHSVEAEDFYRRAVQTLDQIPSTEKRPKSMPTDIAEIRSSLSVMLSLEGRQQESLEEAERAVALLESTNPRYIMLPAILNNEACTLYLLGRKTEAERIYQRALQLATALYGEDNRNTAKIMLNYAKLLQSSKEGQAAEVLRKKGSEAYRRSLLRDNQTIDVQSLGK